LLVGRSEAMERVIRVVRLVASRRCTVLIQGETGTGKEMVAKAIHAASNRSHLEMVAVNCNALPENLLEAELFGHVKGAFTAAVQNRIGRFEQANRSTLFLDEIGDLPMDIQVKLLRVLQEREFQRLGSSETIRVDTRVVTATNVDIASEIRNGRFREDLYYRLNVVPILVPALRERREDIPLLVEHLIDKVCRAEDMAAKRISQEAMDRLSLFDWPGNVRQLENAVEMALALSGDRATLELRDFPLPSDSACRNDQETTPPIVSVPEEGIDFERVIYRIERDLIAQALRRTNGNKKQAANILRLKRTTFTAKLKSLEAVASY
jgi:DNA-binding NtrC family response regulator